MRGWTALLAAIVGLGGLLLAALWPVPQPDATEIRVVDGDATKRTSAPATTVIGSPLEVHVTPAQLEAALADPSALGRAKVASGADSAAGLALRLAPASPLQSMGLRDGDILLAIDGVDVLDAHGQPSTAVLLGKLRELRRSRRWSARIWRHGVEHFVRVQVR